MKHIKEYYHQENCLEKYVQAAGWVLPGKDIQ
jgi:hypothetical protein